MQKIVNEKINSRVNNYVNKVVAGFIPLRADLHKLNFTSVVRQLAVNVNILSDNEKEVLNDFVNIL